MIYIPIKEYNLSINEFKEPTVAKDAEAIATLLVRLLLLEPGTIQSHPNMGCGVRSRYRYASDKEALKLELDFNNQVRTYLPYFQGVKIRVGTSGINLLIYAEINSTLFSIYFNTDDKSIKSSYVNLSDMK